MLRAWLQASRPLAQANIAVPLVFGQALNFAVNGTFDWTLFAYVQVFGVLDQLFIVYANDVADVAGDEKNQNPTLFSGGSRVLVEGKLTRRALGTAAVLMASSMVLLSGVLALYFGRSYAPAFVAVGILLMWAYSFRPLRLSYRGDGEVLQGLGIGLVLPAFGFYVQSGELSSLPVEVLGATFLLGYGGNVTTALPDYPADLAAEKRTLPVRIGERAARWVSLALLATASLMPFDSGPELAPFVAAAVATPPIVLLLMNVRGVTGADASDPRACVRFVFLNGAAINALLIGWSVALFIGGAR